MTSMTAVSPSRAWSKKTWLGFAPAIALLLGATLLAAGEYAAPGSSGKRHSEFDVRLLDVHSDPDHHRSVFTLAGEPGQLARAVAGGGRRAHHRVLVQGRHEVRVLGQGHLRRARVGERGGQPGQAQDVGGGVADGAVTPACVSTGLVSAVRVTTVCSCGSRPDRQAQRSSAATR